MFENGEMVPPFTSCQDVTGKWSGQEVTRIWSEPSLEQDQNGSTSVLVVCLFTKQTQWKLSKHAGIDAMYMNVSVQLLAFKYMTPQ